MQKSLLLLSIPALIIFFTGCHQQTAKKDTAFIEHWFAKQQEFTGMNNDSVLYYTQLIEKNNTGLPAEYKAMGLIGKGFYHATTKTILAVSEFTNAMDLLKSSSADSLKAVVYEGLGVCNKKLSDYPSSLDCFLKALRIYEKLNNKKGASLALANIGEVYQLKNELPAAKRYIREAMAVSKESGDIKHYLISAQTLANIYGMSNQFDSALAIDNMGIAASDSINSTTIKSAFYNNKGNCLLYSKKLYDSAAWYFNQCVLLDSANGNVLYMSDNYYTLGMLNLQQKKYAEAEKNFHYCLILGDSVHSNYMKVDTWEELSEVYRAQNKHVLALAAKDSASAVKDRMINEKSETKIAELKELYEADKKEQTIALQQSKLSKQRLIIAGGIILLAVLILWGFSWYRRYKLKKEKELQETILQQREEATINILTAEEKERKRIAAELHDGVGQLMTAAWLNLQVMEKQTSELNEDQKELLNKTTLLVGESCKEVRQVSHNMMPNALLKKGLVNAIKEFTQQIDRSVISINLQAEGLQTPLNSITETILYRVIQECVNNSIKHAAATELDISIHNNEEGVSLLIEDNGKGFDTSIINNGADGLGLQNIRSRISFLKGTVQWDSSPGNGTVVAIHLPPQENERTKN